MAAPVNSVLPAITGTVAVDSVLTVDNGTWTGGVDSYAYAWLRSGTLITGATANTYTITRDDISNTLVGRVTATNVDGSTTADSLATVAVPSTLIVETGAIVANADSYVTLAYALEYHAKMGNSNWASIANDNLREGYIRKAMAYMMQTYMQMWQGYRVSATQPQDWPREWVQLPASLYGGYVLNNVIPIEVKDAICELALRAKTATLSPDLTQNVKKKSVGSISVEYDEYSKQGKRYESVVNMLKPYLNVSNGSVQLMK